MSVAVVAGTLVLRSGETDAERTARVLSNLRVAGLTGILENIAARFAVTPEQIVSRDRSQSVVRARQALYWSLSSVFGKSTPEIGELLALDHSTVVHGLKVVRLRAEEVVRA